jgi:hypothetical protein
MMDEAIRSRIAGWTLTSGADPELLVAVSGRLGVDLPPDYRAFILEANGGEGFVNDGGYLKLWPIDEIESNNEQLHASEFAPDLVFFGSDGGGEGYAFDRGAQPVRIVQVPLVGMAETDTWISQGDTLAQLLDRIGRQQ